MRLVRIAKPRVISITPNPSSPGSSFLLVFLPCPSRSLGPRWKEKGHRAPAPLSLGRSAPARIPRNNTKISARGGLPPLFSLFVARRSGEIYHRRSRTFICRTLACYVRKDVYTRKVRVSSWPSHETHRRTCLLFLAFSFLPAGTLIYSAHKRCSQITVPFMTLLLHRRTRSFLR